MERIVVWIDVRDEETEQVRKKLEKLLNAMKVSHKVVDVSHMGTMEDKH